MKLGPRRCFITWARGNLVSTELFDANGFITHSAGQRGHAEGQPAWNRDGATTFAAPPLLRP